MATVDLPIPVVVTRHQCPHCRITRAKRAAMVAHIGRCWRNPAVRACKTCRHYEPPQEGPYPQHPGWSEDCGAGELIGDYPTSDCPSWQPTNQMGCV